MAKKKWPVFISASVLVGALTSLVMNKKKQKNEQCLPLQHFQHYAGSWWFIDQKRNIQHSLDITPKLKISIDQKPLDSQVIELTETRLSFLDTYGYRISITCENQLPFSLYDEANDEEYQLQPKR